jgi:hypothetical protein
MRAAVLLAVISILLCTSALLLMRFIWRGPLFQQRHPASVCLNLAVALPLSVSLCLPCALFYTLQFCGDFATAFMFTDGRFCVGAPRTMPCLQRGAQLCIA